MLVVLIVLIIVFTQIIIISIIIVGIIMCIKQQQKKPSKLERKPFAFRTYNFCNFFLSSAFLNLLCFVILNAVDMNFLTVTIYHKIPKISPGPYIFSKALSEPGLIFGGVYIWRGLSMEGNLRFKIDCASLIVGSKFTVFALFFFVFEGNFPSTSPQGAYIRRGDLTEGFFALPVWGTYLEGFILEGVLICGILRYIFNKSCSFQGCAVIVQTWPYLKQ